MSEDLNLTSEDLKSSFSPLLPPYSKKKSRRETEGKVEGKRMIGETERREEERRDKTKKEPTTQRKPNTTKPNPQTKENHYINK